MPRVGTGIGVHRNDRGDEEIVPSAGAAVVAIPRRAVAGSEVNEIQKGVVRDSVPDSPAATHVPPVPIPRSGRGSQHRRLEAVGRVPRHSVETPDQLAARGVVGGEIAPDAEFAAGVAYQNLSLDDAGRAGDGDWLV